jgi:hypothetical protein
VISNAAGAGTGSVGAFTVVDRLRVKRVMGCSGW